MKYINELEVLEDYGFEEMQFGNRHVYGIWYEGEDPDFTWYLGIDASTREIELKCSHHCEIDPSVEVDFEDTIPNELLELLKKIL